MAPTPVSEDERYSVITSLNFFINPKSNSLEGDRLLRLLRTKYPDLWGKVNNFEEIQTQDLPDEAVRDLNDIIYYSDLLHPRSRDADPETLQSEIRGWMYDFNDAYFAKLSNKKFEELLEILKAVVVIFWVLDPGEAKLVKPSSLPPNVQGMIFEYLYRHLPDDVKAEIAQRERGEREERDKPCESEERSETEAGREGTIHGDTMEYMRFILQGS